MEKELEKLFNQFYPSLTLFARKYVHDLETAREIVQELFVSLWEKQEHWRMPDSPKNYLFQAVRNRALNHLKQQQREALGLQHYIESHPAEPHFSHDPIEMAELEARLHQCIHTLPPACRNVFILSRFEGKKNEEIARELGISKRTVETHISKALRLLRQKLYVNSGKNAIFFFSLWGI